MKFNRVCVEITHSLALTKRIICFEHEVPIREVAHGKQNVIQVDDKLNRTGPVNADFSLEDEWDRLLAHPRMVKMSETSSTPAPLVAFPRGVLDLEDFYTRLRRSQSTKPAPVKAAPDAPQKPPARHGPMELPAKELRAITKQRLDDMGIEYKGNASTDSLVAMLDEVAAASNEGEDANVQN